VQKVAAYLLECTDGMQWAEARQRKAVDFRLDVESWLRSKGAAELGSTGTYQAQDGSLACFQIDQAADGERATWLAKLEELSLEGRRFVAAISVTNGADRVSIYCTLSVGSDRTLVNPLEYDPKCPKVIRDLLQKPERWFHGFTRVSPMRQLVGFEAGEALAAELKHPDRTIPFVAVSADGDVLALPALDQQLAYDLGGIANVVRLDSDAAWALTDYLGKSLSCFSGAVRLYWPKLSIHDNPYRHPLWTSERLRSAAGGLEVTTIRFRKQLRTLVMGASALSVVRPREIDSIREAASRRIYAALKRRASSLEDFENLSELYASDNDKLRLENDTLRASVESLEALVSRLEGDKRALSAHLEAAKLSSPESQTADAIRPDTSLAAEEVGPPSAGEIRYYKKKFSAPSHDVLLRVKDCGHNKWQAAAAADKARKGIAKVELGRDDWKLMQHCGSCTGGGMWRVRW
jgi:hypothetical protein